MTNSRRRSNPLALPANLLVRPRVSTAIHVSDRSTFPRNLSKPSGFGHYHTDEVERR